MQEYLTYLKKFYLAILIIIISIVVAVLMVMHTIPELKDIGDIQNNYTSQLGNLENAEKHLAELNTSLEKEKEADSHIIKAFYKPTSYDLENEAAISEEFAEILQILRDNRVKTYSLKFEPNPADDNFVKNVPERFNVSRMTASMIASYTEFENFLRELYKHEHFMDISSIEIKPYHRNKKILIIDLKLKLYSAKTDAGTVAYNQAKSNEPTSPSQNTEQQPPKSDVPQPVAPQPTPPAQPTPAKPKKENKVKNNTPPVDESEYQGDEMTRKHKVYSDKVKK